MLLNSLKLCFCIACYLFHVHSQEKLCEDYENQNMNRIEINNTQLFDLDYGFENASKTDSFLENETQIQLDLDANVNLTIERLDLSYHNLVAVTSKGFDCFSNLKYLDLSFNRIRNIDNAFITLSFCENLNISSNRLTHIQASSFTGLRNLKELVLSYNYITYISPDCFVSTPVLQDVDFSENPLSKYVTAKDHISLFFSYSIKWLICENCQLSTPPILMLPLISALILSKNKLQNINVGEIDHYLQVRVIDLSENIIETIQNDALRALKYLEELNISSNRIKKFPRSLPSSLRVINVTNNMIETINSSDLSEFHNLKYFYISQNQLKHLPNNVFESLKKLEVLYINDNKLTVLSACVFNGLRNLEILDLSNNPLCIKSVEVFVPVTSLQDLYISMNDSMLYVTDISLDRRVLQTVAESLACSNFSSHRTIGSANQSKSRVSFPNILRYMYRSNYQSDSGYSKECKTLLRNSLVIAGLIIAMIIIIILAASIHFAKLNRKAQEENDENKIKIYTITD